MDHDEPPANARKCTLVRSPTNQNNECFLEPECHNVCTNQTNQVCSPYQDTDCVQLDVQSCNTVTEEKCETRYLLSTRGTWIPGYLASIYPDTWIPG